MNTMTAAAALDIIAQTLPVAGGALGCTEADPIARALAAAGHLDAAVGLLVEHAVADHYTDEPDDSHGVIARAVDTTGSGAAAARAYLLAVTST
jgi:hypothetical protein